MQLATRTTLTLAVSLGVLYLLTKATGQPVTVALLGVVIAMMSAMAVNDPDPRQQKITLLLLPVPAAAAVTLGALLAPHKGAGDIVFVAIIFAAPLPTAPPANRHTASTMGDCAPRCTRSAGSTTQWSVSPRSRCTAARSGR